MTVSIDMHAVAGSNYQVPTDCGCTLLQKTHDLALDALLYYLPLSNRTHTVNQFDGRGILILRDPFKSIKSYRNFDYAGMQGVAPTDSFAGKGKSQFKLMSTKFSFSNVVNAISNEACVAEGWDDFVARSVASWETLAEVWIRGLKRGGIIYYERLKHETSNELKRLANLLGLKIDPGRLQCVLKHAGDNTFKRPDRNNSTSSE